MARLAVSAFQGSSSARLTARASSQLSQTKKRLLPRARQARMMSSSTAARRSTRMRARPSPKRSKPLAGRTVRTSFTISLAAIIPNLPFAPLRGKGASLSSASLPVSRGCRSISRCSSPAMSAGSSGAPSSRASPNATPPTSPSSSRCSRKAASTRVFPPGFRSNAAARALPCWRTARPWAKSSSRWSEE